MNIEDLCRFARERVESMTALPGAWGSVEAVEGQVLTLIEIVHRIRGDDTVGLADRYTRFLFETTNCPGPTPVLFRVRGDERAALRLLREFFLKETAPAEGAEGTAEQIHEAAMELAELTDRLGKLGVPASVTRDLYAVAAERELRALRRVGNVQPSNAVFYRSAATLTLQSGNAGRAKELAEEGLAAVPPPPEPIRRELEEVLRQARSLL